MPEEAQQRTADATAAPSQGMGLAIGSTVGCSDQEHCGELTRVVVDPVKKAVTHIVVTAMHDAVARLVPLEMVIPAEGEGAGEGNVRLLCSCAGLEALKTAEETEFVPGAPGYGSYSADDVIAWPYYALAISGGVMAEPAPYLPAFVKDKLPPGEVGVRRGEQVHATDGDIGRVQGLVIDPADHHVTHVLLQEGHLWGRKQVAIPIGAVVDVEDGIRLSLGKQDVADLPPVELATS